MQKTEVMGLDVKGKIKCVTHKGDYILNSFVRPNVITYAAADIMAKLVGNDSTYVPRYIGFIYGADATAALLLDPDSLPTNIKREHRWSNITTDVASVVANVLVSPLILNPAFTIDGDDDAYEGNILTLAAFTGTYQEYAFPTDGVTYAGTMDSLANVYVYQALLLNRRVIGSDIIYTPFARVTLRNPTTGVYDVKPAGFDMSLFWSVSFT